MQLMVKLRNNRLQWRIEDSLTAHCAHWHVGQQGELKRREKKT